MQRQILKIEKSCSRASIVGHTAHDDSNAPCPTETIVSVNADPIDISFQTLHRNSNNPAVLLSVFSGILAHITADGSLIDRIASTEHDMDLILTIFLDQAAGRHTEALRAVLKVYHTMCVRSLNTNRLALSVFAALLVQPAKLQPLTAVIDRLMHTSDSEILCMHIEAMNTYSRLTEYRRGQFCYGLPASMQDFGQHQHVCMVDALRKFPDDRRLADAVMHSFMSVSSQHRSLSERYFKIDCGIPVVIRTMALHATSVSVATSGCRILSYMSRFVSECDDAHRAQAAVADALKRYPECADLVQAAVSFFFNTCGGADAGISLNRDELRTEVSLALSVHTSRPEIQILGNRLLVMLETPAPTNPVARQRSDTSTTRGRSKECFSPNTATRNRYRSIRSRTVCRRRSRELTDPGKKTKERFSRGKNGKARGADHQCVDRSDEST